MSDYAWNTHPRFLKNIYTEPRPKMKSDTPETDAMIETDRHRIEEYSAPLTAYRRICDLCRQMEIDRNTSRDEAQNWRNNITPATEERLLFSWENR